MISAKITIPPRLKIRLSRYNFQTAASQFVSKVADEALLEVMTYGEGRSHPTGGAPWWQGKVTVEGHRRGFLSDSHHIVTVSPLEKNIVSSAGFAYGVIEGVSTNWGIVFTPNPYHKRAADSMRDKGSIKTAWRTAMKDSVT